MRAGKKKKSGHDNMKPLARKRRGLSPITEVLPDLGLYHVLNPPVRETKRGFQRKEKLLQVLVNSASRSRSQSAIAGRANHTKKFVGAGRGDGSKAFRCNWGQEDDSPRSASTHRRGLAFSDEALSRNLGAVCHPTPSVRNCFNEVGPSAKS